LQLGEALHKTLDEIMELTETEIVLWAAYFELKGKN